jgi:hypothetical protein
MARVRHVCRHCGINNSEKPHGLCRACFQDWSDAQEILMHGINLPDEMQHKLRIQAAAAGWQLFMADNDLRWRALGKPFVLETAAENAGRIVLAAAKLLHRNV